MSRGSSDLATSRDDHLWALVGAERDAQPPRVSDLHLRADDGPFVTGSGPMVTGSTLALVMTMAGRAPYLDQLDGPGVPILRSRLDGAAA